MNPRLHRLARCFGRYLCVLAAVACASTAAVADGPLPAEGPIDMRRFRPNLVVDGSTAWAEDGWRRMQAWFTANGL